MRVHTSIYASIGACAVVAACDATNVDLPVPTDQGTSSAVSSGSGGGGGGDTDPGFGVTGAGNGGVAEEPICDGVAPDKDNDGDGWTTAQGDCNDCTAQMNPGAQDYPGNTIDEDCNGVKDDNPTGCDSGLSVESTDPIDGAKAIGICKAQKDSSWGLVSAEYLTADGQPLEQYDAMGVGHGLLQGFGPSVHPQEGERLLALSSGTARLPGQPGYQAVSGFNKGYPSILGDAETSAPPGFPKESPSCPGVITGAAHDSAGLLVRIKTPTNAKSLRFNLNFYTYEFPQYICSTYNDFFIALLTPKPAGGQDGNISFDSKGNLISVNAGFLQVCHAQMAGGKDFDCSLGFEQLSGTGFDEDSFGAPSKNSAATGWLETTSPVQEPGEEISLLFTIWDSGDGALDSTILVDNFSFDVKPVEIETRPIGTPK